MGTPNPGVRDGMRSRRKELSMDGEPLNVQKRDAQQFHTSIYVNITDYGTKTHGIGKGEQVQVETYQDGIFIRPINGDE